MRTTEKDLPEFVNLLNIKNYNNNLLHINKTFNYLTLINIVGIKNRVFIGKFLCKCGKEKELSISSIIKEHIKSCGCLHKESAKQRAKHNMHNSIIYKRWSSMKARCNRESDVNYKNYGARGITYCSDWENFINFYFDMKEGFHPSLEIDRIDVNGNYNKDNCRWVTHNENNFNKTLQSNNVSGKTGVSWLKSNCCWRAYISINKRQVLLGYFDNYDDAVKAREEGELKYYGYLRGN